MWLGFIPDWRVSKVTGSSHALFYANQTGKRTTKSQPRLIDESEGGEFKLSLEDKAAILRNNIHGVDIDSQAVEITMMSLYIKMLEGERGAITGRAILPRLRDNIKCGNSLIGYDIGDLSADERARINPLDWSSKSEGFGEIMEQGGFDAVIGNPPYGAELDELEKTYLIDKFKSTQYKFESFAFFIEKGISLLNQSGKFGFIVPNTWLDIKTFSRLRQSILQNSGVQQIVNLGKGVFTANIDTALLFVCRSRVRIQDNKIEIVDASDSERNAERIDFPKRVFAVTQNEWMEDAEFKFNVHVDKRESALFGKIRKISISLGEITESSQGLIPYNTKDMSARNPYIGTKKAGKEWKPFLDKGACVSRYALEWNGLYVKFGKWLYTPNQPKYYENEKILIQRHRNPSLQRRIVATIDDERYYFKDNLCCVIGREKSNYDLRYLLGILNSTLLNVYYKKSFTEVSLNPIYLRQLPIRAINFSDPADESRHNKMVALVEQMLDLHKQKQAAKSDIARERIEREIHVMDEQIDALVYELYGLTKEEIKIVEGQ